MHHNKKIKIRIRIKGPTFGDITILGLVCWVVGKIFILTHPVVSQALILASQ